MMSDAEFEETVRRMRHHGRLAGMSDSEVEADVLELRRSRGGAVVRRHTQPMDDGQSEEKIQ